MWTVTKHRKPEDSSSPPATKGRSAATQRASSRQSRCHGLKLPRQIDFRSFRTMHSILMGRAGARPEVIRDNMGHHDIDVSQNIYGKSWWGERVDAVSAAVDFADDVNRI
jgi:hypothetical protein